jgi:serine protease AprX
MPDEELRIAVYTDGEREEELAREALLPDTLEKYVGMVEGWATRERVQSLIDAGLVVDLLDQRGQPVKTAPTEGIDSAQRSEVEKQANSVSLDPRLKELSATPEPEDALPEDVYNVRVAGSITAEQRKTLGELGIEISLFEPPATYRLFLTREQYAAVRKLPWVEEVSRYGLHQSLAPELAQRLEDPGVEGRGTFDCVLHRPEDLALVRKAIADADGAEEIEHTDSLVRFEAGAAEPFLAALAQLPQVRTLAPYEPQVLQADYARRLIGIETLNAEQPQERWTGEGEIVGIFDSGVDREHPDIKDRVIDAEAVRELSPEDSWGHGTHVAGLIAGTGAACEGKIRGAAPGARIFCVAITDGENLELEPDLNRLLSLALVKGAKIINLSWGGKLASQYDQGATRVDKFVYENPEVLVVVAAGNEGSAPEGYVELQNIGTPATAKNVVTVGASDSDRPDFPDLTWGQHRGAKFPSPPTSEEHVAGDPDLPAGISSRGPANDYRVKPDLLAPGTCILSVRASKATMPFDPPYDDDQRYAYLSGTSMATPLVSGAAAVLRQYLREERDTATPSAALLKATLVAAARRLPAIESDDRRDVGYPDFDQGYGRLDLASVLPHAQAPAARRLVWDDVRNDSPDTLEARSLITAGPRPASRYTVEVLDSGEPLRIVLTWTDYPGPTVQNNLHLDVGKPDGGREVGNREHRFKLDPKFDGWEGVLFDRRNTVEEVRLENPAPGRYSIRVVAQDTPFGQQGYALAVCGLLSEAGLVRA